LKRELAERQRTGKYAAIITASDSHERQKGSAGGWGMAITFISFRTEIYLHTPTKVSERGARGDPRNALWQPLPAETSF